MKSLLLIVFSVFICGSVCGEERRIYSDSPYDIWFAKGYDKDSSIFGLGINGHDDPDPRHISVGWYKIDKNSFIDVPMKETVTVDGRQYKDLSFSCMAVYVAFDGQRTFISPYELKNVNQAYQNDSYGYTFKKFEFDLPKSKVHESIPQLRSQGKDIDSAIFFSLNSYRDSKTERYRIGGAGTYALRKMEEARTVSLPFAGEYISVKNQTGRAMKFTLSLGPSEKADGYGVTLVDVKEIQNGETQHWIWERTSPRIMQGGDRKWLFSLMGVDKEGKQVTWGGDVKVTGFIEAANFEITYFVRDGKRWKQFLVTLTQ